MFEICSMVSETHYNVESVLGVTNFWIRNRTEHDRPKIQVFEQVSPCKQSNGQSKGKEVFDVEANFQKKYQY